MGINGLNIHLELVKEVFSVGMGTVFQGHTVTFHYIAAATVMYNMIVEGEN
jgi:hypothetical protein